MSTDRVVLSLGSNEGDRGAHLLDAAKAIAALDGVELAAISRLWESPAWVPEGATPGGDYLNCIVLIDTDREPRALMDAFLDVEADGGRVRDPETAGFGDRPIDIDIVEWPGRSSGEGVDLPHPRAADRDFVLAPWLELDQDATLSGVGRVDIALAALPKTAKPWTAQ